MGPQRPLHTDPCSQIADHRIQFTDHCSYGHHSSTLCDLTTLLDLELGNKPRLCRLVYRHCFDDTGSAHPHAHLLTIGEWFAIDTL